MNVRTSFDPRVDRKTPATRSIRGGCVCVKESKSEVIRIAGLNWRLSLEPELAKDNSVPNIVEAAIRQKSSQEDREVASK